MKRIFLIVVMFSLISCKENFKGNTLKTGIYRAMLNVKDSKVLPFNFEVLTKNKLLIFNADEVIEVDDVSYKNDSVYIRMPVFEGYISAKIYDDGKMSGYFIKKSLDRIVPFSAEINDSIRFYRKHKEKISDVSGNWEVVFSPNSEADRYIAKGIFKQENHKVTGTFRTTTGDYRYLEGILDQNELKLSTFDGAHAFLFTAEVTDSTMKGMFYSGNHWKEPFKAVRNESYELPDANTLTFLKEGYNKFEFSFPDVNGKIVSLNDDRFRNKVVLVQIMGTWCPNCLDETKFYSSFYNDLNNDNFEIVALAFEYAKTEESAINSIKRLEENLGIRYPVLLAQFGSSSKVKAQEKLPMLNHVLSYPTSIFIDKKGAVRKIHTGFNGPATGEKFTQFKQEFNDFVNELLRE